jgi:hypothetical protein
VEGFLDLVDRFFHRATHSGWDTVRTIAILLLLLPFCAMLFAGIGFVAHEMANASPVTVGVLSAALSILTGTSAYVGRRRDSRRPPRPAGDEWDSPRPVEPINRRRDRTPQGGGGAASRRGRRRPSMPPNPNRTPSEE